VEAAGTSYEPVSGALRRYVAALDDAVVESWTDGTVLGLSRLMLEVAERHRTEVGPSEVDRSWLFSAARECVTGPGDAVLVVLDDLQWTDWAAVLLLSKLTGPASRVRVLGTRIGHRAPNPQATSSTCWRSSAEMGTRCGACNWAVSATATSSTSSPR
jgi:hypothetical protein